LLLSALSILQIGELGFLNIVLNEADKDHYEANTEGNLSSSTLRSTKNLLLIKRALIYFSLIGIAFSLAVIILFVIGYKVSEYNTLFFVSLLFTFLNFCLTPYLFISEGSGFIKDSFRIKAIVLVISSSLAILFITLFRTVYVILFNAVILFVLNAYFFNKIFGLKIFLSIGLSDFKDSISWIRSKFSFQIKLAISYLIGQATYSYYQFVVYKTISIEAVGIFGVSYTIISVLVGIVCLFSTVKYSYVATLYSRQQYDMIKPSFLRDRNNVLLVSVVVIPLALLGFFGIHFFLPSKASRIVAFDTYCIFLVAIVFSALSNLIGQYSRANNKELMFWEVLFLSLLNYVLIYIMTLKFGLAGLAIAYLLFYVLVYFVSYRKFSRYIDMHIKLVN
jgi:O-antigen/teichoic acid export membrane protein